MRIENEQLNQLMNGIRIADKADLLLISSLAREIWPVAYQHVLSNEQIQFMLADIYSLVSLEQQMMNGATFLIAEENDVPIGFTSFSSSDRQVYRIHKLYILPECQNRGIGAQLISYIASLAKKAGGEALELNVNRNNPAVGFYKKLGFQIQAEVDIPYHHFVLNDYVMRLPL